VTEHIEGLIAAPFTPMGEDGGVNLAAVEPYADLLARNGVAGVFACGTTGESLSLTVAERMEVAGRWTEVAAEGLKVIIHVGATSIEDCRALARHAAETGAFGIGAMGPCFFKPQTVEDLVAFCARVAEAAPSLPFYYYHIPGMAGVHFSMADFLEAATEAIPTLAGIKYTWEDLVDFGRCLEVGDGRFDLLYGRDETLLAGLAIGARGAVGSTFNFAAPLYRRLMEAFEAGDLDTARDLQRTSREMIHMLYATTRAFLPAAKSVMKMVGLDCGPVRLPMRNLTPEEAEHVRAELGRLGFDEYCVK